ncbi:MAG: hypothetical protein Aurels2KO_10280 [Aureliella sp.]
MTAHAVLTSEECIASITSHVVNELAVEELLDRIYDECRDFIAFDRIGWAEIQPKLGVVRARWARTGDRALLRRGFSAQLLGSSLYYVITERKPRVMDDLAKYLAARPGSRSTRLILAEGIRSSVTCPLFVGPRDLGFLFFSSSVPDTYSNADVPFAMEIARLLSLRIATAEPEELSVNEISVPDLEKVNCLPVKELKPGMILRESLRSKTQGLLLASGHTLTPHSVDRLIEMYGAGELDYAMVEVDRARRS